MQEILFDNIHRSRNKKKGPKNQTVESKDVHAMREMHCAVSAFKILS